MLAAHRECSLKVCEALLQAGADLSITDNSGKNALDLAASSTWSFKYEIIKLINSYKK